MMIGIIISIIAGILIPLTIVLYRLAKNSGKNEERLRNIEEDINKIFKAIDQRVRWIEERIWGRDERFPRKRDRE